MRYFPVEDADYRMRMGLMALSEADWIEVDEQFRDDLKEKRRLAAERPGDVFQAIEGSEPAGREVLCMLARHLPAHFPALYKRTGERFTIVPLDESVDLGDDDRATLETAGRLVQEDLCLMAPSAQGWRLMAASLSFPTRWRLAEKIGRPLGAIHGPVPGFAERLGRPVDRFFQHIRSERGVWRLNWSITDDPSLFQPDGHFRSTPNSALSADNAGQSLWFRVERQTLRRLRQTGWVLFTIRIHHAPLCEALSGPERARRLLRAVETMPAPMRAYKSIAAYEPALSDYLRRQAAA